MTDAQMTDAQMTGAPASDLDCPSCADERAAGASFCEACGRPLTDAARVRQQESDPAACPHCGTPASVGPDGYCSTCGMLAGRPRDHMETDLGPVAAAVTDRGKRHHRNEDAVFLTARDGAVDVVVCDGVSSSGRPVGRLRGSECGVPGFGLDAGRVRQRDPVRADRPGHQPG